ncbi:MAG: endolytic transglycosylase MltG [Bifidobacteriaceae bacterium]|jgi:UPF0755 protein|nr:endolytic transglycosylase MltG [Bifidobacteriaceae bacterium]
MPQFNRSSLLHKRQTGKNTKFSKKFSKRTILIFTVCIIVLVSISLVAYNWLFSKDYWDDSAGQNVVVTIPSGSSTIDIANILVGKGVVLNSEQFVKVAISSGVDSKLQAGSFNLKVHQSSKTAIAMLMDSNNRTGYRITIPEGYTVNEIINYIAKTTNKSESDLRKGLEVAKKKLLPKEAGEKSEGWLFPATYIMDEGIDLSTIFSDMITKTVNILKAKNVPNSSWKEVLIKASITQKEVSGHDYYGKVARVIDNRLETGATGGVLGMDTVVAYGANVRALDLTQAQLDDSSNPYNDRIRKGLPPTPISNPGEDAIAAVINPPKGDWLYFCTVNLKSGETKFTASSDEFEEYKRQYQKWMEDNPNFDS